jgi:hypothetical protein
MFLRVVRAAGGKGVKHEYVRDAILSSFYRPLPAHAQQNGKTPHIAIVHPSHPVATKPSSTISC